MLPSYEALLTVFISSLIGSLHCVGMCGGLVALCCINTKSSSGTIRLIPAEIAYHLMRLVSYLMLGAAAGAVGNISTRLASAIGFQKGFAITAGSLLVLWGLRELGALNFLKLPAIQSKFSIKLVSQKLFKWPLSLTGTARGAFIGLLSGLLPCGWLYAYVIAAAATKDPFAAMVLMFAFWLGTVPILVLFAGIIKRIDSRLLSKAPMISALFIIALGIMTMTGRLSVADSLDLNNNGRQESSCH